MEFHSSNRGDMLQVNMEMISKELSDLMLNCDEPGSMNGNQAHISASISNAESVGGRLHQGNMDGALFISPNIYQQQNFAIGPNGQALSIPIPNGHFVPFNIQYNLAPTLHGCPEGVGHTFHKLSPHNAHNEAASCDRKFRPLNSKQLNMTSQNFELQYISRPIDVEKLQRPLLSTMANRSELGERYTEGRFSRKYSRPFLRDNPKPQIRTYDYSKIVVDLSALGISTDGKESNAVLRLFSLFRDIHSSVAMLTPTGENFSYSVYEPTFAPSPKAILPNTMNVQSQVKHSCNLVMAFIGIMQQLIDQNSVYDQNIAIECQGHLFKLRQIFAQFEMYKFVGLEHKRGLFISDAACAQHLEKLMEQMNAQIRDVHLRIMAADWYIGKMYFGEKRQNIIDSHMDDMEYLKRSQIGVINEILQLCESNQATEAPADAKKSTAAVQAPEQASMSKMNYMKTLDNEAFSTATNVGVVAIKDCNANIINTCNGHVRQPVFYIG
ncbi:uncharacterized protein LOC106089416 isoform X2 [Stomoxys calcitrans]|uniref:uncharacterized protein LOC106089416 isoform X2 n=1 Tax=Stomoxys calcitrans TaxID=35570 RepID=UPI0027E37CCB|nr:uncharacterized protein LOC106089416 isoform X2 [Stomoxys calcitrans]